MTRLFDDPARFSDDMLAGFADANAGYVTRIPGGVVRARPTAPGKVAVVVGGGSGHYPAFCGVVGAGLADGAVVGNVFTSPSAEDAASVARAAHGDSGVLLITGNYAGDVLNFTIAVDQLRAAGIAAHYLAVTDDVASAPPGEETRRRGIAGDFTVFKCAGAAAETGLDLSEVVRVAGLANAATRSLGVAFGGCTLPGGDGPLFSVPGGRMDIGMGIHGEPGINEVPLPSATDLAVTLVDGLLRERPDTAGERIAVILNGLGSTKYEELFVVWGAVARLLRERGCVIVEPEVGELVTSLDMAGCSLTLMWLDDELERFWTAPADTPAYRKGVLSIPPPTGERRTTVLEQPNLEAAEPVPPADEAARSGARLVAKALETVAKTLARAEAELGRIDAVAGDGDHGRGMVKGSTAAFAAADGAAASGAGQAATLAAAGRQWAARAGGTSGVLWGALLGAAGGRLRDHGVPDSATVVAAVSDGCDAVMRLGGAARGDKTMVDALLPFLEELRRRVNSGETWCTAWAPAADAATAAARATAGLRPKVGRARPLAERSVGTPDAGATSLAMCVSAVADFITLTTEGGS